MDIGSHCSYSSCKTIDFLPYSCRACASVFCADHHQPWDHSCSSYDDKIHRPDSTSSVSAQDNNITHSSTVIQDTLAQAKSEASANDAKNNAAAVDKQEQLQLRQKSTLDFVRQNLPSVSKKRSSSVKDKGSSSRQNLLVLRRAAVPLDPKSTSVPTLNRTYFSTAYIPDAEAVLSNTLERKIVWSDSRLSLGRTLDLIASFLKVKNNNDVVKDPSKALYLYIPVPQSEEHFTDGGQLYGATLKDVTVGSLSQLLSKSINDTNAVYLVLGHKTIPTASYTSTSS